MDQMLTPLGLRTWIDIDLDALVRNYRTACDLAGESLVTCVLKSNAYGHGAPAVAAALQEAGCKSFAVSCAREALQLRQHCITGEILVMAPVEDEAIESCLRSGVTLTCAGVEDILAVGTVAEQMQCRAAVHLKADTGFHRLGFPCDEKSAKAAADALRRCKWVQAQGLYSHLGLIDMERDARQHDRLLCFQRLLRQEGVDIHDLHLCDSIGLVRYPQWHYSRCRVGALLYGERPYHTEHMAFANEETLAFRTKVSRVHTVEPGEIIGYSDDGQVTQPMRVATLCAGYGDGYPRCLSGGRGQVLIRGRRAPIVGVICMDQMMADVTGIPDCAAGDTATLLGGGISYAEYAGWCGTNRNECITILSARPVRLYHQGGRLIASEDRLMNTFRTI